MVISLLRNSLVSLAIIASLMYSQDVEASGRKGNKKSHKSRAAVAKSKPPPKIIDEGEARLREEIFTITGEHEEQNLSYKGLVKRAVMIAEGILDSNTVKPEEIDKAIKLFKLADRNNASEIYHVDIINWLAGKLLNISIAYLKGLNNRPVNRRQALYFCEKAIECGLVEAELNLPLILSRLTSDYLAGTNGCFMSQFQALVYCKRWFNLGCDDALKYLPEIIKALDKNYREGHYFHSDKYYLLNLLRDLDDPTAKELVPVILTDLARDNLEGINGCKKNHVVALKQCLEAVNLDHLEAKELLPQFFYTVACSFCEGINNCPLDLKRAHELHIRASALGYQDEEKVFVQSFIRQVTKAQTTPESTHILRKYFKGLRTEAMRGDVEALNLLKQYAADNNKYAQYYLGQYFYVNLAQDSDGETAVDLFRRSAEQGHRSAMYVLGSLYSSSGKHEEAMEWLIKCYKREDGSVDQDAIDRALPFIGYSYRKLAKKLEGLEDE